MLECPQCHGAGFFTAETAFGVSGFCTRCSGLGKVHLRSLSLGEHACYFYDDDKKCLETIVSFLAEGLRLRQQCVCVLDKLSSKGVLDSLSRCGFNVVAEQERKRSEQQTP